MGTRVIIVDDEPLAISVIEGYLQRIPGINIIATFNDGLPAFEFLQENEVDIMFLDVEMPKLTGIELVRSLQNPPAVIITSANKDYAIEGFDLNVSDYILKPITFERLLRAISKVKESLAYKKNAENPTEKQYIIFKENKKNIRVRLEDILYFESIKDYVKVVTKDKNIVTKLSIASIEEKLDKSMFIRVHRSFIVSLKHIDSYSSVSIGIGEVEIPIGRVFKEEVIETLESKLY